MRVLLLGEFSVQHHETLVTTINTPRLQALLAFLLLHRDAPQLRAHIAFLFWPDTSESQARTNLRNLLYHLRLSLADLDAFLNIDSQELQWKSDAPLTLDVEQFTAALAQARDLARVEGPESTLHRQALEQAVQIYRGDLLPSCYDDWIIPLREELRQKYLDALDQLVTHLEKAGDYRSAISYARQHLHYDPLHEDSYRRLMHLYSQNDDRAGALWVYHTCATLLQRELGVEPAEATRAAYEKILGTAEEITTTELSIPFTTPLVGRELEWSAMLGCWQAVYAGGKPHIIVLHGEPGIGKSRLMDDLLQWASRQGIFCASARCYAAEGALAYAPVITWLRAHPLPPLEDAWLTEIARLLPEVAGSRPHPPRAPSLAGDWQRRILFEGLSRAMLGHPQPLLLTMDDLQWCDRDTLEWLHFLLHFDPQTRLLVVGAYRPEEIDEAHPLLAFLNALRQDSCLTELDLHPLDEPGTRSLSEMIAGRELDAQTTHTIFQETEGNPLFVIETMRAGSALPKRDQARDQGRVRRPTSDSLPPRVRTILEARLAQLSPEARELAGLAATIGREFSYNLLSKASALSEDTLVHQLDELWRRRIIREHGTDTYYFSHDKLREVAYEAQGRARRRFFHRRVAQVLEMLHASELDPVSHEIASHFEQAGIAPSAIQYYLRAAGMARRVFANEEAISILQRAISLLDVEKTGAEGKSPGDVPAIELHENLADIYLMRALYGEALQALDKAAANIHDKQDVIRQARLKRKTAVAFREQRLYDQALDTCRQAQELLEKGNPQSGDEWWDEWLAVQVEKVWAYYWLARWPEMDTLLATLSPMVQKRSGPVNRTPYLMASCLMHLRRERYRVSDAMLKDSLEAHELSREWCDARTQLDCQFELGFLHLWRRELEEARDALEAALARAEIMGILPTRTLALNYLTVVHRMRGDVERVEDYASRTRQAAEDASMPDYIAAALGNQAWLAWRSGDLIEVEQKALEALALWQPSSLVYPFQWMALWPILAACLKKGEMERCHSFARAMLKSTQQILPDDLAAALRAASSTQEKDQPVRLKALHQAVRIAEKMGYL